ncbi:hypothetical protein NHQ30_003363 [Ciborinia camelliae]|nr:hypothetical protein NHQ30_003363 [Ciborinia camelliae]
MASATGIPENSRVVTGELQDPQEAGYGEDEPLLGRAGDASQQEGRPLLWNLALGTAVITQVGLILLVAHVWASIFLSPLMLFSAHPLLNSAGLLVLAQGILILQPTHTATQKREGTIAHAGINALAGSALIAGLVIIEVNKFRHNGTHFESPHAILGLITYILLLVQSLVGFTQYYTPSLYGDISTAKSIYKYHRLSGYLVLLLMLATISAATWTDFNVNALHIKSWAIIVCSVLVLVGIIPRIKKQKLGLGSGSGSGN